MSQTKREQTVLIFFGKWLADSDRSSGFHNSNWKVPKTCSHNCELNMMFCCIDHKESVRIQDFAIKQRTISHSRPLKATQGHSRPLKLWLALSGLEWPWVADCLEWPWVADWPWAALSGRLALSGLECRFCRSQIQPGLLIHSSKHWSLVVADSIPIVVFSGFNVIFEVLLKLGRSAHLPWTAMTFLSCIGKGQVSQWWRVLFVKSMTHDVHQHEELYPTENALVILVDRLNLGWFDGPWWLFDANCIAYVS